MIKTKVKVLVVDDSAFMRKAIENMLLNEPDIEVVGMARNGEEAVEMASKLSPDVITMDIEMPRMDGLVALERIMKTNPTPVIMVSSLTQEGAEATLRALDMGAVDFIPKDKSFGGMNVGNLENDIKAKIRKFARNKSLMRLLVRRSEPMPSFTTSSIRANKSTANTEVSPVRRVVSRSGLKRIVALGTSTGGPQSLQKVIPLIPADIGVPIVITQHMPPNFTQSLATRLNSLSKVTVVEAQGKEKLEPNVVYIAKGGMHLKFKKVGTGIYTELSSEPSDVFNIPSVDVMVKSIVEIYGNECLGVIMTGMGSDGCKGLQELKHRNGLVIAQDEASCIVYGMPRAVVDAGIADEVVPLEDIAARITYHIKG